MVDYHSDREHVSRSDLATFALSRRLYKKRRDANEIDDEKEVFKIGKGTHAITLNDVRELDKIVVIPEDVLDAKGARSGNDYTRFKLKHRGKNLLLKKQWRLCEELAESLNRVEIAERSDGTKITVANLVAMPESKKEQEHRWVDVLPCRIKSDLIIELPNLVLCLDIKTARSIDEREFRREVKKRKLWLQVAHYSAGLEDKYKKPVRFVFVAVDKSEPHEAAMFELDPDTIQAAAVARLVLLNQLKECMEKNVFVDPIKPGIKMLSVSRLEMGV